MFDVSYLNTLKLVRKEKAIRSHYQQDKKEEAVSLAVKIGTTEASQALNIPYPTLRAWFSEKRPYKVRCEEFKRKAISKYMIVGVFSRVAKELDIPVTTLKSWVKNKASNQEINFN